MRSFATTGIYLDKNYSNKEGKHPVKIRVTYQRKSKFYKTGIFLTEKRFNDCYKAPRPRGDKLVLKAKLDDILSYSKEIIEGIDDFSFAEWESTFYKTPNDTKELKIQFELKMEELYKEERFSSYEAYKNALAVFTKYWKEKGISKVLMSHVTSQSLKSIESWMVKKNYSITTVGIYMRCLRHIYNRAIDSNDASADSYPFGQGVNKYSIPETRNIKKGIDIDILKKLEKLDLSNTPHLEKARDYWLISFFCNGANFMDILLLRHENWSGNTLTFVRSKSKYSRRTIEPTLISLNPKCIELINKYKGDGDLIFDILKNTRNTEERRKKVKRFTRFINQHMKTISRMLNLEYSITCMYARHSWASLALNKGVSIEFISSGLSHQSIKTTKSYLRGFNEDVVKKNADLIFEDLL